MADSPAEINQALTPILSTQTLSGDMTIIYKKPDLLSNDLSKLSLKNRKNI